LKNEVMRRGYLSRVRCRLFGPADATSPIVFCLVKMQNGFFSGTNVPRLSWKERLLNGHL